MIAIKSWIERLIARCAKTNEKNTFTDTQTFSSEVDLKNNSFNSKEVTTSNNIGNSHRVLFLDMNNNLLGSIDCYRTLSDSIGVRFTLGSKHLGFQLSDEGIATSFTEQPYESGPDNQIATIKYVTDKDSELQKEIDALTTIVREHTKQLASITETLTEINQVLLNIDDLPTKDSKNLVYSGGVYSYLGTSLEEFKTWVIQYIEETLVTVNTIGFGDVKHLAEDLGDDATYEYTPEQGGILVIRGRTGYNLDIYIDNVLTYEDLSNGGEHGSDSHTIPVKAGVKYKIEGHIADVWFAPLKFTYK